MFIEQKKQILAANCTLISENSINKPSSSSENSYNYVTANINSAFFFRSSSNRLELSYCFSIDWRGWFKYFLNKQYLIELCRKVKITIIRRKKERGQKATDFVHNFFYFVTNQKICRNLNQLRRFDSLF